MKHQSRAQKIQKHRNDELLWQVSQLLERGYPKQQISVMLNMRPEALQRAIQRLDAEWQETYSKQAAVKIRRKQVSELYKEMHTVAEIADLLDFSPSTIKNDIIAIENSWRESRIDNVESMRIRELAQLDQMERTCIKKLDACKNPTQGSRWMEERRKIKEARARLLGLNAAQQFQITSEIKITKEARDATVLAVLCSQQPEYIDCDTKLIEDRANIIEADVEPNFDRSLDLDDMQNQDEDEENP